jgi:HAE1 family hydrophobic/amphiphilic exporter-1
MGIAVIGGLTFSTIVTLVIVPVIYRVVVKRAEKRHERETEELDFMEV